MDKEKDDKELSVARPAAEPQVLKFIRMPVGLAELIAIECRKQDRTFSAQVRFMCAEQLHRVGIKL